MNKAGPDPEVARRVQGSKRWDHEGKELMLKCSVRAWVPSLVGRGGDRGKRQVPVAAESNMRLEGELEINQFGLDFQTHKLCAIQSITLESLYFI